MKNSEIFWTVLMIVIFLCSEYFIFHGRDYFGNSVTFTVSVDDKITIDGTDTVKIDASNDNQYFRIYAGENRLLATPDEKDVFTSTSQSFPAHNWQIKDGGQTKVTISATTNSYIHVHKELAVETIIVGTIALLMVASVIYLLGMVILS